MSKPKMYDNDLIENTAARIPICIVVDTSGSMRNRDGTNLSRIERVKNGIKEFFKQIDNNFLLKVSAEVAIVGFNNEAYNIRDFSLISNIDQDIVFETGSEGNLGKGVNYAIEKLNDRKEAYKYNDIDYYQPWIIIMSDGKPTGQGYQGALTSAQKLTIELEDKNTLVVLPVIISGDTASQRHESFDRKGYKYLLGFSNKNRPQSIEGLEFDKFFSWLGKSISDPSAMHGGIIDFSELTNVSTDWDEL